MTHPELVKALCKPGEQILSSLTAEDAHVWHMSSCVCGEAGELFDAIKKHVIYRKPYDRANIVEELGDLEFYLEGLRKALQITRQMTLDANVAKLSKRYEELKYSDAQAQGRADKTIQSFVGKGIVKIESEADGHTKYKRVGVDPAKPGADQTVTTEHVRVVHHLEQGLTDCGMFGATVPRDWPAGHLWSAHWAEVDCEKCLAAHAQPVRTLGLAAPAEDE